MTRVVIADDQQLVRTGFRMILTAQPGIEVVGEAATGDEAVEVALATHPDVVLMDIRMPGSDGIEATRRILGDERTHDVRVVILTTFDLDEYVYDALRGGERFLAQGRAAGTARCGGLDGSQRGRTASAVDHPAADRGVRRVPHPGPGTAAGPVEQPGGRGVPAARAVSRTARSRQRCSSARPR